MPLTQPTEENHIRFHGGFLEDKELSTSAGSNRGYLYRMGVRHYSPALGRFLQRDPVGNFRPPNPEYPLASNPYAYGLNQPLEFTDTSGRQACPVPGAGEFLGRGEMDAPDSGGRGDGSCLKPWSEEYRDCINATCWVCCVEREAPGGICDPCAQVGCIPAVGKHSWEQCCEWCCGTGEENAPSSYGGAAAFGGIGIGPTGPLGPPRFGPGDDGGGIWGFFPVIPSPSTPNPVPRQTISSIYLGSMVSNVMSSCHQLQLHIVHLPEAGGVMALAGMFAAGKGASGGLDRAKDWMAAILEGCCNFVLRHPCWSASPYWSCVVYACCQYVGCIETFKDYIFWFGAIAVIAVEAAPLSPWIGLVGFISGMVALGLAVGCIGSFIGAYLHCILPPLPPLPTPQFGGGGGCLLGPGRGAGGVGAPDDAS